MNSRAVLYLLISVVATAAAVLSFSALRDLALVCGFAAQLAWLLPVVVDAGAAAGSLVWLGGTVGSAARTFARALALALLALSVAANALGHGLAAFSLAPAWWVVVIVSAVAPAVLGAVVHLAVLVGRAEPALTTDEFDTEPIPYQLTAEAYEHGLLDEHGMSRHWDNPNALTVRARAALARRRAAIRAWLWGIAEPAITWGAAGTRAVDAAIAAVCVRFGQWCVAEWRDLRHRLFGTAKPAPYTPPAYAPRLRTVTTADITKAIEDHRRTRGIAPETHLRLVEENPAAVAGEQGQEGSA